MPSSASSKVTTISSTTRTTTSSYQSIKLSSRQSLEEFSTGSPSRNMFLQNASLKMSPGWVSGHASLFESPTSPSPKAAKTRRASVVMKKSITSSSSSDGFKRPKPVFISPTGVKTRARRSSIYHKSGKNLLSGLSPKARRESLAAVRSKKLVSEPDYIFTVPTADVTKRKKLVSKKNINSKSKSAAKNTQSPAKKSPKAKSKSKANSPVKRSTKEINLKEPNTKSKHTIKVISSKKSPAKRSKSKTTTPDKKSNKEVSLDATDEDDDDNVTEEDASVFSPRRTRKTPGKSRKRSLSSVVKSATKRKRSPSKSPAKQSSKRSSMDPSKASPPTKKKKSLSPSKSKKTKLSPKQKRKSTSNRKKSLEVSLTPLEMDDSISFQVSEFDIEKLSNSFAKNSPAKDSSSKKSSKSPLKASPKSGKKSTPKNKSAKKEKNKTPKSGKRSLSTPFPRRILSSKKTAKSSSSTKKTPSSARPSSSKKSSTKKTPTSVQKLYFQSNMSNKTPTSSQKSFARKSLLKEVDTSFVADSEPLADGDIEDTEIITITNTSPPKSKTPLSTTKMKSILDSVSIINDAEEPSAKKRKTTDFVEPQSANKRRRFDQDRFEKIVASTPRDMRLDILSGRRPELSPITNSANKNNNLSSAKQVTVFSDKSTFLSVGPSILSPVASGHPSPLSGNMSRDFVDGNDDDYNDDDDDDDDDNDAEYTHISYINQTPHDEPYLFDYDTDLDSSHSNVKCTIL